MDESFHCWDAAELEDYLEGDLSSAGSDYIQLGLGGDVDFSFKGSRFSSQLCFPGVRGGVNSEEVEVDDDFWELQRALIDNFWFIYTKYGRPAVSPYSLAPADPRRAHKRRYGFF